MRRTHYPEYNKALRFYIDGNIKYFNRYRQSPKLSQVEKQLLEVRYQCVKKEWKLAAELLSMANPICPFLAGDKYFMAAYIAANTAKYLKAVELQAKAQGYYKQAEDRRGAFLSHYNCSVAYNRLGRYDKANEQLELAAQLVQHPGEKLSVLRGQACALSSDRQFHGACEKLEEALTLDLGERDVNELDILVLKSVAVDIYYRSGREAKVAELLEELKNSKLNSLKGRVNFQYYLFKALNERKDLGKMPTGVKKYKEYRLKWEILTCLQSGQNDLAKQKWNELMEMFPLIYTDNFKCLNKSSEMTMFYTFLKKLFFKAEFNLDIHKNLKGENLKNLYRVLATTTLPIRKEEIIEKVWKTDYEPKYDNRLYLLMKRLKGQINQNIVNVNNSYQLVSGNN